MPILPELVVPTTKGWERNPAQFVTMLQSSVALLCLCNPISLKTTPGGSGPVLDGHIRGSEQILQYKRTDREVAGIQ